MTFEPNTSLLKFQSGNQTDAFVFMENLQGEEPFVGAREAYALDADPGPIVETKNTLILPFGPFKVEGTCPNTGRRIYLRLFRDLSCVILRDSIDHGCFAEVLPACLTLTSQAHDNTLKETPYDLREATVACLSFQARDGGIRWGMKNGAVPEEEIQARVVRTMENIAKTILSAPAVVDPRANAMLPVDTRYAPFSKWPKVAKDADGLDRLKKAILGLAGLRAHHQQNGYRSIYYMRHLPDEPWRQASRSRKIVVSMMNDKGHYRTDILFERALRRLVDHDDVKLRPGDRLGFSSKAILKIDDIRVPGSSHQHLACLRALSEAAPGFDYSDLIA